MVVLLVARTVRQTSSLRMWLCELWQYAVLSTNTNTEKELAAPILRVIQCWVNDGESYIDYKEGSQLVIRKGDGEPEYGLSQNRLLIFDWSASILPVYITILHPHSTHFDHEYGWRYEPTRLHGVNKYNCSLKNLRTYIIIFPAEETNPYSVIECGESEDVNTNHCVKYQWYTLLKQL